jgi:nitrite reductase/ring-hydroxylating ferredoxin subunit
MRVSKKIIKIAIVLILLVESGYLLYDIFSKGKKAENENGKWFCVGEVGEFERGKIYPFNSEKFYLSVLEDGGMLAVSIKCTHLGCSVEAHDEGFLCPCHGSEFDKYGMVTEPPATRALDIFPIKIENGKIYVKTNDPIKRETFNKSQLTYAE